jgi:hypothetical protein
MQRLNTRLLDAYIAAWTGTDGRFSVRQVHEPPISFEPKLQTVRFFATPRSGDCLTIEKQHRYMPKKCGVGNARRAICAHHC